MDREFLDLYNRELSLLYEQASDFAEQYPGIAERLGGCPSCVVANQFAIC